MGLCAGIAHHGAVLAKRSPSFWKDSRSNLRAFVAVKCELDSWLTPEDIITLHEVWFRIPDSANPPFCGECKMAVCDVSRQFTAECIFRTENIMLTMLFCVLKTQFLRCNV